MSSPFLRLVWKEYRAQRMLWVTLAGCLIGLQLLFLGFSLIERVAELTPFLAGTAVVLTCCFAATSPALLFAGEEDLSTAGLLRLLPVSPRQLFWSKVCTSLAGTVAMALAGAILVLATAVIAEEAIRVTAESRRSAPYFCCTLFIVSLFWSLRCRRVFHVLGLTTVTFLTLLVLWEWKVKLMPWWVDLIPGLVFAILIVWQPRRWQRGVATHGSRLTVRIARFLAGLQPSWSSRLQRAATVPTPLGRLVATLAWREFRFAVPFVIVSVAFAATATLIRVFVWRDFMWPFVVLFFVVIECGLRTFRHDHIDSRGMFWSHRGVSSLLVLIIRNGIWMSALIVTVVAIVLIDLPQAVGYLETQQDFRLIAVFDGIRVPQLFAEHIQRPVPGPDDRLLQLNTACAWVLGGFFICQLCAAWIRRPLIALFPALTGFVVYNVFLGVCVQHDIPLILCAWPIVMIFAVAVVLTRRQWMDGRSSLRITGTRLVLTGLAILCVWPVCSAWRILQVAAPDVAAPPADQNGYTKENEYSAWAGHWKLFSAATQPLYFGANVYETNSVLAPEAMDAAMSNLDGILEFNLDPHLSPQRLPPSVRHPWSNYPAQTITFACIQRAQEQTAEGAPDAALSRLTDAVQLLRYLQREATSWDQWQWAKTHETSVLQHIHLTAVDRALTGAQLIAAAERLQEVCKAPVLADRLYENRMAVYSQLLCHEGYLWRLFQDGKFRSLPALQLSDLIVSERLRLLRIINLAGHPQVAHDLANDAARFSRTLSRWAATTAMVHLTDVDRDPHFSGALDGGYNYFDDIFYQSLNAERATVIILRLHAWKRQHGSFPASLNALRPDSYSDPDTAQAEHDLLTDIQTGLPFAWSPDGLQRWYRTPGDSNTQTWIDPRQPVVRAQGARSSARITDQPSDEHVQRRKLTFDPERIVYLDASWTPVAGPRE